MIKEEKIVPREMKYYEEKSFISVQIPKDGEINLSYLEKKLAEISDFKLLGYKPNDSYSGAIITCEYKNVDYEIEIYMNETNGAEIPDYYLSQGCVFNEEEIKALRESTSILCIDMKFKKDPRNDYQLQLKIAKALVPSLVSVFDESALRILPPKLVKMLADSKYLMSPKELYIAHAVYDEQNNVWLHTHGLNRCGVTELEVLNATRDNSNNLYNILNAFACYIIENKSAGFDPLKHSGYIGILNDRTPLVLTCVSWVEALPLYEKLDLGGINDRNDDHDGLTSVVFQFTCDTDGSNGKILKLSDYPNSAFENAILFYSDEETERMSDVARERINVVFKAFDDKENRIHLKIGLKTNNENNSSEHIWFELVNIKDNEFSCKLIQEPYQVKDIKVGDIKEFSIDDITDWVIYTKNGTVSPDSAYILMD